MLTGDFSLIKKINENCEVYPDDTAIIARASKEGLESLDERNARLMKMDAPLSFVQSLMVEYQYQSADYIGLNVPQLIKFGNGTDIGRLKKAVDTVLATHPAFSLIYLLKDDMIVQRYVPGKKFDTVVEEITEAELETIKNELIRSFEMIGEPLYRARLFKTEKGEYLFVDFHHSIIDGVSRYKFINDICDAYDGKPLEPDYYFAALDYRKSMKSSSRYEEGRQYYERHFEGFDMPARLKTDIEPEDYSLGVMREMIFIEESFYGKLKKMHGLNKNGFFITVTCFVLSAYNEKDTAIVTWLHNSRFTPEEKSAIGILYQCYPVGLRFDDTKTLKDVYCDVKEQIHYNKYYSCYPYLVSASCPEEKGIVNINFLNDLKYLNNFASKEGLTYTVQPLNADNDQADNLFDIEISDMDSGCLLELKYIAGAYKKESINRFKDMFMKTANLLMENLDNPEMKAAEIISTISKQR